MDWPTLGTQLAEQLAAVEPSRDRFCEYRPCQVTLRDGRVIDRVYLVAADQYIRLWGIWPHEDPGKRSVELGDVVQIVSSPTRLPAECANKLYAAGESGMGYMVFTVVLTDGRELPFVTGDAVDFPSWPDGIATADVADVLPHRVREHFTDGSPRADQRSAEFYWCLHGPDHADAS